MDILQLFFRFSLESTKLLASFDLHLNLTFKLFIFEFLVFNVGRTSGGGRCYLWKNLLDNLCGRSASDCAKLKKG